MKKYCQIILFLLVIFCCNNNMFSQVFSIGVNASFQVSDILNIPVDEHYMFVGLGIPLRLDLSEVMSFQFTPSFARLGSRRSGKESFLRVTEGTIYLSSIQFPLEVLYRPKLLEILTCGVGVGSRYFVEGFMDYRTTTTILSTGEEVVTRDKGVKSISEAEVGRWDLFLRMGLAVDIIKNIYNTNSIFFSVDLGLKDINRNQNEDYSRTFMAELGIRSMFQM